MSIRKNITKELEVLSKEGTEFAQVLSNKKKCTLDIQVASQKWYSKA